MSDQLVLHNGIIYLGDGMFSNALLIQDGRVKAYGSDADIIGMANSGAQLVNLRQSAAVPGLNDSHMHLLGVAKQLNCVQLNDCTSLEGMVERCRKYCSEHRGEPGFIEAKGWNQELFCDEARIPDRFDLDRASTDMPIAAARVCGHITSCNTKALEVAGITADTVVPGGKVVLGDDGKPNGILLERAGRLIWDLIPEPSEKELAEMLREAMEYAASVGLTSVQTNDLREENYSKVHAAYSSLFSGGRTPIRITHQIRFADAGKLEKFLDNPDFMHVSGYHSFNLIKLLIDGSLGAHTALMRRPYADSLSTFGVATMTQEYLDRMVAICQEHGKPVGVHAIGDGGIEMVLNSFERYDTSNVDRLRHAVIHCQITGEDQLKRIKESDVLVYAQPVFLNSDWRICAKRVGPELEKTSNAFGTLLRGIGHRLSYGTDSPVESLRPVDNIHCAINRTDLSNQPKGGYFPAEVVSVQQAVDAYTAHSAYASGEEDVKGKLFADYFGDVTVFDRDIFSAPANQMNKTEVAMTITGGEIVYQKRT